MNAYIIEIHGDTRSTGSGKRFVSYHGIIPMWKRILLRCVGWRVRLENP